MVPDSDPAKDDGLGELPVTLIVKLLATAVPPLSFTTCLMTVNCAAMSSLVIVQVFVSPIPIEPEQSADSDDA